MRITLLLALFTSLVVVPVFGQDADVPPLSSVDELILPAADNEELQAHYASSNDDADDPAPLRFAEPFEVNVLTDSRGTWHREGEEHVWRLVVRSDDAYSLNFGFSRFHLPEGAQLIISEFGKESKYRPFTSVDNEEHGELWTPIVPGGRAVLELRVSDAKGEPEAFELELSKVSHAFLPIFLNEEEKARLGYSPEKSGS